MKYSLISVNSTFSMFFQLGLLYICLLWLCCASHVGSSYLPEVTTENKNIGGHNSSHVENKLKAQTTHRSLHHHRTQKSRRHLSDKNEETRNTHSINQFAARIKRGPDQAQHLAQKFNLKLIKQVTRFTYSRRSRAEK
jgi:hypothetical protein